MLVACEFVVKVFAGVCFGGIQILCMCSPSPCVEPVVITPGMDTDPINHAAKI